MKTWDSNDDYSNPQDVSMVHSVQPANTDFSPDGELEIGYPLFDQRSSNLICYYPNAEASGTTMYDVVNGNDGTYNSVTHAQAGILGRNSIAYDGSASGHAASASGLAVNGTTFSATLWLYYPSSATRDSGAVLMAGDPDATGPGDTQSNGWTVRFDGTTDTVELIFWDGGSITGTATGPTLNTGQWHFISARGNDNDTGNLDVYFEDGTSNNSTLTGTRGTGGASLFVGGGNGGLHTDCRSCHIRGYDRELTDTDVTILALQDSPTGYITTKVK